MNKIEVKSNGKKLYVFIRDDADESVAAEIFKEHEYRAAEEIIKTTKLPIIDVGAHTGMFALYARSLNSTVKIVCVEPEPGNLEYLQKHIAENTLTNIEIVRGALAESSGKGFLQLSDDSHNHHLGQKSDNSISVDKYSLPDLLKKCIIDAVGLIKLDIEGEEHDILLNLNEDSFKKLKAIIFEYHNSIFRSHKQLENKLREMGFGVQIFPSKFDKTMGFIFALNKRATYGT